MDPLRPLRAFDRVQQRHLPLAFPVAVIKKFGDDQGGGLAALVAYYAFFSLFPLLLVFLTVLGYVLQGDSSAEQSIRHSVLAEFPIVGQKLDVGELHGSVVALVIGLATSLWAGLGVTGAARNALDRVWAVPFKARPNFFVSRWHGLLLLLSLGSLFIVATLASGLVTGGLGNSTLIKVAGIVFSLLLNLALFFAAFRLLTSRTIGTSELWAGVMVAGVLWTLLQSLGGYYIGHVLKSSHGTYAQFGFVIALLIWLHLGSQLTLLSAEINVVLTRRLWPRSLFGPPTSRADRRTLGALAMVEERSPEEQIEVSFDPPAEPAASGPPPTSG